ncbi:MAG: type VI secretion system baseplate subunit TssK, partial [Planctomycetales bacterium]
KALNRPPRALPRSQEWVYFQVTRGNAAWMDVQATETLAMRLQDRLIRNLSNLQGQRKMIVSYKGSEAELQFALFAVPKRR